MDQLQIPFEDDRTPSEEQADFSLRPIHYLGSKLRMLGAIDRVLDEADPDRGLTCDLFSGSGVVSSSLSKKRRMLAVDIQEYARVLGEALINPVRVPEKELARMIEEFENDGLRERLAWAMEPLISAEERFISEAAGGAPSSLYDLLEAGSVARARIDGVESLPQSCATLFERTLERLEEEGLMRDRRTIITRYYGGLYFGFNQSIKLDYLLTVANSGATRWRDLLVAAVLSTASETTATVGNQFAQPLRPRRSDGSPKPNVWKRIAKARSKDVFEGFKHWVDRYSNRSGMTKGGRAVRADFREFLTSFDGPVSAFYVDPPYTRDHYSRYYHVLETMSLRDNPDITRSRASGDDTATRGLYREGRHQSPFCIKSKAPSAFKELFSLLRDFDAPVALSYSPGSKNGQSRPRVMDIQEVARIAESSFGSVEEIPISQLSHSKLTRKDKQLDTPDEAEKIMLCKP